MQATSTTTVPWITWFWFGHSTFLSSAQRLADEADDATTVVDAGLCLGLGGRSDGLRPARAIARAVGTVGSLLLTALTAGLTGRTCH